MDYKTKYEVMTFMQVNQGKITVEDIRRRYGLKYSIIHRLIDEFEEKQEATRAALVGVK